MTEEPQGSYGAYESFDGGGSEDSRRESPFSVARRALRGRWTVALALAGALGGIGAWAGYATQPVLYTSQGLIEITPVMPRVLHKSDNDGQLPMFDAFVETQAALAASRRVIDAAMDRDEWRALGRPRDDEAIREFQKNLAVTRGNKSQYLLVGYTDADPEAARVTVNAVVKAYQAIVD